MRYNKKIKIAKHAGDRAFTLVEIMAALLILALITSAVFAITRAALQASANLAETQAHRQQIMGLIELCNENFRSLPGNAFFETRRSQEGQLELLFVDAPRAFAWGNKSVYGNSILSIQPQPGGLFSLVLIREKTQKSKLSVNPNEKPEQQSLILIRDLSEIAWRFFYAPTSQWINEWTYRDLRPSLVELSVTPAGEETPIRAVFWVPSVKRQVAI
ncbi:MAG: type II secretion system GspH family protein [Verrucomicrobiae bacterium]|nr:type II secretion system GspH family protein [Verrucomicrobiae bacterium]